MQSERHTAAPAPKGKATATMSRALPYPATTSLALRLHRLLHLPGRLHLGIEAHPGWWILPAALLGAAFWIWIARLIVSAF
ncbi:hypothetical protein [Phaeovulum sp. W22_SRMD_FR3]|uniref:hypothetical protein n=1 Tax=Phaeovulum sp. W22_SRMD_FR3 TaxID=3240274 RepID=UPI003F99222D